MPPMTGSSSISAPGDIAITADIPLAARCLDKGARVLGPNGKPFTPDGIGMALGMRELSRHLREVTRRPDPSCRFFANRTVRGSWANWKIASRR